MNTDRLSSSCLRIMLAVWTLEPPITVRAVAEKAGFRSPNSAFKVLHKLRACGLVAFDDGHGATIRPTCSITIFKE